MRQLLRRVFPLSRSRGQMMVLLAMGFTALLGFVAVGVDGGIFYWQQSRMQNAADGAASAAIYEVATSWDADRGDGSPGFRTTVAATRSAANSMAYLNGLDPSRTVTLEFFNAAGTSLGSNPSQNPFGTTRQIKATVSQPYSTTFLKVVGVSSMTANATAKGVFGGFNTLSVFPIGIGIDVVNNRAGVEWSFYPPASTPVACPTSATTGSSTCANYARVWPTSPPPTFPAFATGTPGPSFAAQAVRTPLSQCQTPAPTPITGTPTASCLFQSGTEFSQVDNATVAYIQAMVAADTSNWTCAQVLAGDPPLMPNPKVVKIAFVEQQFGSTGQKLAVLRFGGFMFTSANTTRFTGCWVPVNTGDPFVTLDTTAPLSGVTTYHLIQP